MKGEWKGPEVPVPGYAKNFLQGPLGEVTAEWPRMNGRSNGSFKLIYRKISSPPGLVMVKIVVSMVFEAVVRIA